MAYADELYDTSTTASGNGSNYIAIQELDSDGDYTGDPVLLPAVSTSSFENAVSELTQELENGDVEKADGATERTFTVEFAQSDVQARNLFKNYGGKTFTVLKEAKEVADPSGGIQYFAAAKAKLSKNRTIDMKSPIFEATFNIQSLSTDFDMTLSTFDNAVFAGNLGAAANQTIASEDAADFFTIAAL